ncbi:MAG: hypothetical protein JST86_12420 [Bacteroidetes bacterium]|nr:hypothetical protein [Bacteroidota bacterium]
MKKLLITVTIVFASLLSSYGQSKQVKLYLKQIGLNEVLINYLKKAMAIAKFGLTTIADIKNGEFSLHRIFFDKLKAVNPKIKNLKKVADIITLQVQIIKNYQSSYKQIKASKQFSNTEINYIYSVFSKLLDDTGNNLEELYKVLAAAQYQMTDDERIKRIDDLYIQMQSNYVFTQHFSKETLVMAMQRMKESNELKQSRDWYGIK